VRKHLLTWRDSHFEAPKWLLSAKYFFFAILGLLATIFGASESLNVLTFEGYTTYWSAGLTAVSLVALVASFRTKWEQTWEKWAAVIITGLLLSWAAAAVFFAIREGDTGRVQGAFAIFGLTMLPGSRALGLIRKTGRTA
jgi:hypothetical protein